MPHKIRLLLMFSLASMLPLALLQIYLIGPYSRQQRQKISVMINENMLQKKVNLEREFEDYVNLIFTLMTEENFSNLIHQYDSVDKEERAWRQNKMQEILSRITYQKRGLVGLIYIDSSGEVVANYNKYQFETSEVFNEPVEFQKALSAIKSNSGKITSVKTVNVAGSSNNPYSISLLGSRFSDLNRTTWNGFIFLLINEKEIHKIINPESERKSSIFSYSFLFQRSGKPFSFSNKKVFEEKLKTYEGISFFEKYYENSYPKNETLVVLDTEVGVLGLDLYTVFMERELFGQVYLFKLYTLFISIFAAIMSVIYIRTYIIQVSNSIHKLRKSMTIENDQLTLQYKSSSDLDYLNRAFFKMQDRINRLIQEQNKKNRQLLKIEEEKRFSEIRALEAQVNPHFLYNTLNSLNWMAIGRNDTDMSSAITDLADLLRYSISGIDALSSLSEEIKYIEKYLNIQLLRFENLFEYDITCEIGLKGFRMYKMLLQPFIENSIIHGFQSIAYKGFLSISITSFEEGFIRIIIIDNGCGYNINKIQCESIGISNSSSRLRLYYGNKSKIKISSKPNSGTKVELIVPEIKNENSDC